MTQSKTMDLRPIENSDLDELQSWLNKRPTEHVDVDLNCLPKSGFIVPGIAAFFYTMTNIPTMWIDTFITNPDAELSERRQAGKLFAYIIKDIAKHTQIERVFFLTRNNTIEEHYRPLLNAQYIDTFRLYRADFKHDY